MLLYIFSRHSVYYRRKFITKRYARKHIIRIVIKIKYITGKSSSMKWNFPQCRRLAYVWALCLYAVGYVAISSFHQPNKALPRMWWICVACMEENRGKVNECKIELKYYHPIRLYVYAHYHYGRKNMKMWWKIKCYACEPSCK